MRAFLVAFVLAAKLFVFSESIGFKTTGSFKLGEYVSKNATTGQSFLKSYYLSTMFRVDWMTAYAFCKENEMTLATFADLDEALNLLKLCNQNYAKFGNFYEAHIGGFKPTGSTSKTNWFWYDTGDKIDFKIPWNGDEPNNDMGTENCLSLIEGGLGSVAGGTNTYLFNDCHCYNMYSTFICQEVVPQ